MTIDVGAFSAGAFASGTTAVTGAITTNASGSSFVIFVNDAGTARSVADNKGNTGNYVQIGATGAALGASWSLWLCTNGSGGAGHTATATATGSPFTEAYLVEITGGALASLIDATPGTQWNDDAATPFTSNSVTTTNANDLILAFAGTATTSGTETLTWGNSFTQVVADGSSADFSGGIAKLIVSATGTYNSTFTSAGGGTAEAFSTVVAFKAAAGGAVDGAARPARAPGLRLGTPLSRLASANLFDGQANGPKTVALTGRSATFTPGTLTGVISGTDAGAKPGWAIALKLGTPISRLRSGYDQGTAANTPLTVALTGQAATFTAGTLIPSSTVALLGQAATFNAGTLTPSFSVVLTGQGASFAAGSVTPSTTVPLLGQLASFTAGTMTPSGSGTVALTGQSATFTAGTLVPSLSVAMSGASAAFSTGTMTATPTVGLIGQSATSSAGAFGIAVSIALTGQAATFTAGTVTVSTGANVTVALTGVAALFGAGQFTTSGADVVSVSVGEVPAGRRTRNIYRVTIDGVVFECRTYAQALALLAKAKETARKLAEDRDLWAVTEQQAATSRVAVPKIDLPTIEVSSRELRAVANQTRREIKEIYERQSEITELRMLLELSKRAQEDDETLMFLM